MSVTISGDTGVSKVQDGVVVQADLASGVAGTGPAFFAYANSAQNISNGVATKIVLNAESFDTNSNFDVATNYRFTPTVAGYYFIQGSITLSGGSWNTGASFASCYIYKNGAALFLNPSQQPLNGNYVGMSACGLVYLNGSTDYIELYSVHDNAITNPLGIIPGSPWTYMSGFLARAA